MDGSKSQRARSAQTHPAGPGLRHSIVLSAFRRKVLAPVGLIFQIIGRRLGTQLPANEILHRTEVSSRERRARSHCRIDRRNPTANQRNAQSVQDNVVTAREPSSNQQAPCEITQI